MNNTEVLKAVAFVGAVQGSIVTFEQSGTSQKQVQLTLTSGRRVRVTEGQLAFANACYVRPGDEIEFTFQDIDHGKFIANKDTDREREVKTTDYVGIGEIKVLTVGSFSDEPEQVLKDAGRSCVTFTERTIPAKQAAPPAPPKQEEAAAPVTGDSPFQAEGH